MTTPSDENRLAIWVHQYTREVCAGFYKRFENSEGFALFDNETPNSPWENWDFFCYADEGLEK